MLGCDSGFSMFGFQARMTRAPGLSGLEPRLKQRKRSLGATLVFASATWCGFAIRCASTTWFGWFRAPLKPYLATALVAEQCSILGTAEITHIETTHK